MVVFVFGGVHVIDSKICWESSTKVSLRMHGWMDIFFNEKNHTTKHVSTEQR